jgi:hypothetical protein
MKTTIEQRQANHDYYKSHRKEVIKRTTQWNRDHKQKRLEIQRRHRQKIRLEAFSAYSNGIIQCACCGEKRQEFLSIDHIRNNGAEERRKIKAAKRGGHTFYSWLKKQGYPEGYQVLCFNCNIAKSVWGYCPHEREMLTIMVVAKE